MSEKQDTWRRIGDVAAQIVAALEEKQRREFERECEREGIKAKERAA